DVDLSAGYGDTPNANGGSAKRLGAAKIGSVGESVAGGIQLADKPLQVAWIRISRFERSGRCREVGCEGTAPNEGVVGAIQRNGLADGVRIAAEESVVKQSAAGGIQCSDEAVVGAS